MNNINMNIEYYEDYDDELHIDNSKPNTGLEWNTDEYIHVDFINFLIYIHLFHHLLNCYHKNVLILF